MRNIQLKALNSTTQECDVVFRSDTYQPTWRLLQAKIKSVLQLAQHAPHIDTMAVQ